MNDFLVWFKTGFEHILDWNGYDHILYIIALCVSFSITDIKKLFILISAFTLGHSITLALSTLNLLSIPQTYIEILIPLTILVTCINNLSNRKSIMSRQTQSFNIKLNYSLAAFFGLIHGLGFSYLLKSMLGKEDSIIWPLLSFNIGIEVGQMLIVLLLLVLSAFLFRFIQLKSADWVFFISSAVFGISFIMFVERSIAL
jgi:hydrogenase/urease accessory protein HupE